MLGQLKQSNTHIEWPQEFTLFLRVADTANAGITHVLGAISCSMNIRFLTSFTLQMLLPPVVLLLLLAAWAVARALLRGKEPHRLAAMTNQAYSLTSLVLFLLYPGMFLLTIAHVAFSSL